MNAKNAIRWGIMGTGWVAQHFISDVLKNSDAKIVAVASRSKDRAIQIADRFSIKTPHSSYETLVQDNNVDVVYVATEAQNHASNCMMALNAKKHVLCEKPFATNFEDASRVVDVARNKGQFCMEAMWSRFLPATLQAKKIVEAGEIGDVSLVSADFGMPFDDTGNSRMYDPARGGGALLDLGVYAISLATWIFGKPLEITTKSNMMTSGVDHTVSAILKFTENRIAVISTSIGVYLGNRAVVSGSKGRITISEPFYRPQKLTIARTPKGVGSEKSDLYPNNLRERIRQVASRLKAYVPLEILREDTRHYPINGYGYGYEANEVIRCLREGLLESPVLPLNDTLIVMQVVDEIRRKIQDSSSDSAISS